MRRMWAVAAATVATLALGGLADAAATTPLDFNITMDSGAEAARGGRGGVVPIPLWKSTATMTAVRYGTPGFPSRALARAVNGEVNFFYCGRNTAGSTARQRVRIQGRNRLIDRGGLSLRTTVRIGSPSSDGDAGQMIVQYLDGAGGVIGELQTAVVQATGGSMPRLKTSGAVPPGTRALQVILSGTGTAGTSCDVYFDNVSVKLVRARS
jgi:hypothetical protein